MPKAPRYDVIFTARQLLKSFEQHEDKFSGQYPAVKNPGAIMTGIKSMLTLIKDSFGTDIDHVAIGIIERKGISPRYVISVDETSEEYGERGYLVQQENTQTNLIESLSLVTPDDVKWSPDTLQNTNDENRTKYYIGFIYMICDRSEGYDQDIAPEIEITPEELMRLISGDVPEAIQQAARQQREAELEQQQQQQAMTAAQSRHGGRRVSIFSDWDVTEEEETEVARQEEQVATPAATQGTSQTGRQEGQRQQEQKQEELLENDLSADFEEVTEDESYEYEDNDVYEDLFFS